MFFSRKPADLPTAETALKGRTEPLPTAATHYVNGHPLKPPFPEHSRKWIFETAG